MTKQHQLKYPIILLQNLIKIQWIGLFIVFCIQGVPNKVYFRTVRNLKCFFLLIMSLTWIYIDTTNSKVHPAYPKKSFNVIFLGHPVDYAQYIIQLLQFGMQSILS